MKYTGVVVKLQERLFTCEDLPQTRLPQKKKWSVQNFSPVPPLLDSVPKPLFPLHLLDQLNISLKGRMSCMNYNLCFLQHMGIFRGLWVNHSALSNLNESYQWHPLMEGFNSFLCCKLPVMGKRRVWVVWHTVVPVDASCFTEGHVACMCLATCLKRCLKFWLSL